MRRLRTWELRDRSASKRGLGWKDLRCKPAAFAGLGCRLHHWKNCTAEGYDGNQSLPHPFQTKYRRGQNEGPGGRRGYCSWEPEDKAWLLSCNSSSQGRSDEPLAVVA